MTVFDVGAHAGYYTLAFAKLVGPQGRVVAFEPDAANLANLKYHLRMNRVSNVDVVEASVCNLRGWARFARSRDGYMGKIAAEGTKVRTIPLDDYGIPDIVKIDIEGGEGPALLGMARIHERRRTQLFISLHGVSDEQCLTELDRHGYEVLYLAPGEIHARPREPA